jgi:hypothetical protein
MTNHTPCYVNERQSGLRGITNGWYAMDADGNLSFGPFANRENCMTRIFQFRSWSTSSLLRHRPI